MAVLINGNGYSPVTAQQDADLYAGLVGNNTVVLNVGNEMAAQIINSNTVRILDGEAVSQGRRIHLDPGDYDDFTIPTGTQGVISRYLIGYHIYTDGSGNELVETFVEQIQNASDTMPDLQLRDGSSEAYITLYRVTTDGLTIITPAPMYVQKTPTHIQFGALEYLGSIPANSYLNTVFYFSNPFQNVPTVVCSMNLNSTYVDMGNVQIVTYDVTTTSFKVRGFNNTNEDKQIRFNWVAISN